MPTSARTRRSGLSWKVWWLRRRGTPTHFRCRRRGAHRASGHIRYESAAVERTGTRFYRRGRCLHRPEPAAAASRGKCGGCEGGVHRRTSVAAVGARIARQDTYDMRAPPSNVPGRDSTVGADAYIGPNPPQAGPFDESAQAARARLPPAGDFSRGEEFPKRAGAAAPGPPLGPAACIPRSGITQAAALHLAVPSHTAHPFPASRGPVESTSRYGYRTFL